jgi:hypothetical protein
MNESDRLFLSIFLFVLMMVHTVVNLYRRRNK